jgi:hypothetical protein
VSTSTHFAVPTDKAVVLDVFIPAADQAGSWSARANKAGKVSPVHEWQVFGDGDPSTGAKNVDTFSWVGESNAHGTQLRLELDKGSFGNQLGLTLTASVSVSFFSP